MTFDHDVPLSEVFSDKVSPELRKSEGVWRPAGRHGQTPEHAGGHQRRECQRSRGCVYLRLGATEITFCVANSDSARKPIVPSDFLRREKQCSWVLPEYTAGRGREAFETLFNSMREIMVVDGCGFMSVDYGRKWMMQVVKVFDDLSTFHENLKKRSCAMLSKFSFSDGANYYLAKSKPAPMLTQDVVRSFVLAYGTYVDFMSAPVKRALTSTNAVHANPGALRARIGIGVCARAAFDVIRGMAVVEDRPRRARRIAPEGAHRPREARACGG
jgi:hypothetical protein